MSRKQKIYRVLDIALPALTVAAAISVYAIVGKIVGIEMLVPSIKSTFEELFCLLANGAFYRALINTLARSLTAYLLSAVSAVVFAALTKLFRPVRSALSPVIALIRVMPTMSVILLALIWFDSYQSPVLVAYCVTFPMLYTCICDALDGVDKDLIEMSRAFCVDKKTQICKLWIPQMAPNIFTGMKSSVGLNLKLVIAAEVLAQTAESVGVNMQLAKLNLDTAELLAWTMVAVIIGGAAEFAVSLISRKAVKGR